MWREGTVLSSRFTVVPEASQVLTKKNSEIIHCMSTIGPDRLCIGQNSTSILGLLLLLNIKCSSTSVPGTIIYIPQRDIRCFYSGIQNSEDPVQLLTEKDYPWNNY